MSAQEHLIVSKGIPSKIAQKAAAALVGGAEKARYRFTWQVEAN
ncbi:hypothetical protein [Aeromonas phage 59.1]|nr:hypothetical protein [Aeromonas phage 59.1]